MKHASPPPPLPLFAKAEVQQLEKERDRLVRALARMREKRWTGEIQRTEFRLQRITGLILAVSQGKEIAL